MPDLKREIQYFKVLRSDLTSVGLLKATRMQYCFNAWNRPLEPISNHPRKGGGLWVVKNKGDAKKVRKYLLDKRGIIARIFRCRIGQIIYETSYRAKTDGVFFAEKDEIIEQ